ncbi:TPA: hypothetical protein PXP53_001338 [Yersinia enterocolitica]|uniref:hypothetical protein n=1 Tax=Yersinia kristensenii TaxID=28152 RepID=UPI0011A18DB7|nr:hypothetical protein [Yersinia kristensenii]HDL7798390.1 hypothetical protein [Yersinia enterocolitica]
MSQLLPFSAAANKVINMYELRQSRATQRAPAHSPAERYWAVEQLLDIAKAAAYAASPDASIIKEAAEYWQSYEKIPALFAEKAEV